MCWIKENNPKTIFSYNGLPLAEGDVLGREHDDIDDNAEACNCFLFGIRKGNKEFNNPSWTNSSENTWWNTSPTMQDLKNEVKNIIQKPFKRFTQTRKKLVSWHEMVLRNILSPLHITLTILETNYGIYTLFFLAKHENLVSHRIPQGIIYLE